MLWSRYGSNFDRSPLQWVHQLGAREQFLPLNWKALAVRLVLFSLCRCRARVDNCVVVPGDATDWRTGTCRDSSSEGAYCWSNQFATFHLSSPLVSSSLPTDGKALIASSRLFQSLPLFTIAHLTALYTRQPSVEFRTGPLIRLATKGNALCTARHEKVPERESHLDNSPPS